MRRPLAIGVCGVVLLVGSVSGCKAKRREKPAPAAAAPTVAPAVSKQASNGQQPAEPAAPGARVEDPAPESAAAPETKAAPAEKSASGATGFFRLFFVPPKKPEHTLYHQWATETPRFKTMLSRLGFIALPANLPVVFKECGMANAFYSPKTHSISVCYEYLALFHRLFKDKVSGNQTEEQAKADALNAITFSMLHESGHALISELKLGVSGGEEDAVDDWATIASVYVIKDSSIALDSAKRFEILALKKDKIEKVSFLDEHSLDGQRFGNIYCSLYGSDPKKFGNMVGKVVLTTRAPKCLDEWEKKNRFWTNSLKPHFRGTMTAKAN